MREIGVRLLEIVVAALLAGLVVLVFNGLTTGAWVGNMVFIVPLGLAWSLVLGVMSAAHVELALLLLLTALLVLALYLLARFGRTPMFRIPAEMIAFLVHQGALIVLFAMLGITS